MEWCCCLCVVCPFNEELCSSINGLLVIGFHSSQPTATTLPPFKLIQSLHSYFINIIKLFQYHLLISSIQFKFLLSATGLQYLQSTCHQRNHWFVILFFINSYYNQHINLFIIINQLIPYLNIVNLSICK